MKIKIEVTEKDINEGMRAEPMLCPVALAFRRGCQKAKYYPAPGDDHWFGVRADRIRLGKRIFRVPDFVQKAIRDFDNQHGMRPFMRPFEFELEV